MERYVNNYYPTVDQMAIDGGVVGVNDVHMDRWTPFVLRSDYDALHKQLADAQATIATLQARVRELEQWVQDQSTANLETMRHTDEMQSRALEAEQQLTQHTSELEAAKQHQQLHDRIFARQRDLMAHYVATIREAIRRLGNSTHSKERPEPYESRTPVIAAFLGRALGVTAEEAERERVNLQAELERVRGELAETKEVEAALSSKVAEYEVELNGDPQNFYGRGRTVGLRTLIAALPKVEGAVEVSAGDDGCYILPLWIRCVTKEQADGIAALLQERQKLC